MSRQIEILIGEQRLPLNLVDSQTTAEFLATSPKTMFLASQQEGFLSQTAAISQNGCFPEEIKAGDLCYEPAQLAVWLFTENQKNEEQRLLIKLGSLATASRKINTSTITLAIK